MQNDIKCEKRIHELEKEIERLHSVIDEKDRIIKKTKEYLFVLEYELEKKDKEIEKLQD